MIVDTVHSFKALYDTMIETAYNGILIDLPLLIKSPRHEKNFISDIIDQFPIMQLNYNVSTNKIHYLYYGRAKSIAGLEDFIQTECRSFRAQKLCPSLCKTIHVNITVIQREVSPPHDAEKTVTLDISKAGCFIITSRERQLDTPVEIIFHDLSDQSPVTAQIQRIVPWGKGNQIPGIGVMFTHIKKNQLDELCNRFKLL